jgi:DNA-binding protein HU-beta|uniref:HU family DNA-binding protein n=1 Tax=Prevotella sp. TaxID=59823 RepID=UPI004029B117
MTKNELAREVSVSEKLHLSTTVKAIDGTLRVIKEALAKGEVVVIRGFGTFTPVKVAERTARNFKSGKPLVIPAHTSVKLRASKELVKAINEGKEATL